MTYFTYYIQDVLNLAEAFVTILKFLFSIMEAKLMVKSTSVSKLVMIKIYRVRWYELDEKRETVSYKLSDWKSCLRK